MDYNWKLGVLDEILERGDISDVPIYRYEDGVKIPSIVHSFGDESGFLLLSRISFQSVRADSAT